MSELIHVTYGVWRPAEQVADLRGRVAAVLSTLPAGTVASGVTAARLHDLWLPADLSDRIEVITHPDVPQPRDRAGRSRKDVRIRRRMLDAADRTTVRGIAVTSVERTWFELAGILDPADLAAAGDSALRAGATLESLSSIVTRARHRPGVVRARKVLPYLDARSRSRPESHMRYALCSRDLPAPAVNEAVYDVRGGWLAEPDLSYDDVRLAIEYNGAQHAETGRMRRDITRELDLLHRGGWAMLVFGPAQVFGRPDEVALIVAQARAEREAFLGRRAG